MKKYIGLIIGLLPLIASAQLVMSTHDYIVMSGGSVSSPTIIVLTNPATTALTNTGTGWIISENEFNMVQWNIGTSTGSYVVPFGYSTAELLPVTCDITTAGTGSGYLRFSTYHGSTWDNTTYEPSDVTNMTDFGLTDYSKNAVDRFWVLDAEGYTTKPVADITLTYIRNGGNSEIAVPNFIQENTLIAQRFNSSLDEWSDFLGTTGTDVTGGNTGTVTSGNVSAVNFYRSWGLFNDSSEVVTSVATLKNQSSSVITFPNPTNGSFTVNGVIPGQVIELYDYLGQKLCSTIADNDMVHFDISTKANGVYLMRIENKDGSLATQQKIVKAQ